MAHERMHQMPDADASISAGPASWLVNIIRCGGVPHQNRFSFQYFDNNSRLPSTHIQAPDVRPSVHPFAANPHSVHILRASHLSAPTWCLVVASLHFNIFVWQSIAPQSPYKVSKSFTLSARSTADEESSDEIGCSLYSQHTFGSI